MLLEGAIEELCKTKEKEQHPSQVDGPPPPLSSSPFRAPASVPFGWEEVPGKPKKILRNDPPILITSQSSFTKRGIPAVPFKWEEKPGIPKAMFPDQNGSPALLTLPPERQQSLNSHVGGCPTTLSRILRSIFQLKLSTPMKISASNNSLSDESKSTEEEKAEQAEPLNTCAGSEGEEEMFELDLNAFSCNGLKEMQSSRGSEGISESSSFSHGYGRRSRAPDAAPALLANCLLTMMEMSKAVPVEDSCNQRLTLPSLVSVDSSKEEDSWADVAENQKNRHMFCYQECLRSHSMQPESSAKEIPSTHVYDSPKLITWGSKEATGAEENKRGPSPIDGPGLDLDIVEEKQYQLKRNDNNGHESSSFSSSSSPGASTFVFVEGRLSSSSPLPLEQSESFAQGGGSGMDMVPFGTCPQTGKSSKFNQGFADNFRQPSKEPNHFKEKLKIDARMEETKLGDFDGRYEVHSKRTRFPAKRLSLCMELKMDMISCCSVGTIHKQTCSPRISAKKGAKNRAIKWRKNGENQVSYPNQELSWKEVVNMSPA